MAHILECSYRNINHYMYHNTASKCDFVLKYCGEETSNINTVAFYYCSIDQNIFLMALVSIPWLLLCFYWLSSTCENYLEPFLSKIAKTLRLSESLTGVTLIALANGAPDLVSAYVASQSKQKEGINLAFGALLGASIFTTSVIFARVIISAKNLQLSAKTLVRDCGFYVLANLYFFYLGTLPKIDTYHIVILFITYCLYVLVVIIEEIHMRIVAANAKIAQELPSPCPPGKDFNQLHDDGKACISPTVPASATIVVEKVETPLDIKSAQVECQIIIENQPADKTEPTKNVKILKLVHIFKRIWSYFVIPLNWIRDFTIPKIDNSRYNRLRMAFYPFFSGLFALWRFGVIDIFDNNIIFWIVFTLSAGTLGVIMWLLAKSQRCLKTFSVVFTIIGLVISVLWVHLVADLLIDLLVVIKVASGLPLNFIGLTVLAWGNSANDFFVDVSLAKKGHGIMAASGILSGQFFNMLIGFGMLLSLEGSKVKLNLFNGTIQSQINYILIICSLVGISLTLCYGIFRKFNMDRKFAYFLIAFYVVFCFLIGAIILFS